MPEYTYEIADKGVHLKCYLCDNVTTWEYEIALRHCPACGVWHIPHLKPEWAKDVLELDVVEAALDLSAAIQGGKYGPNITQIKLDQKTFDDAVVELQSENEGKWERKGA